MQIKDVIMSGGVLPAMLKEDLVGKLDKKDDEIAALKKQYVTSGDTTGMQPEQGMKRGGKVSSASSRGDGIAQRGKTKGTMVMCGGGYAKGKR
jgi:hypothetical protein